MRIFVVCVALLFGTGYATKTSTAVAANPIRKVVTMMQKMSEKIEQEGESEKDLYDKFMCHCKSELEDFNKGKAEFEAAVPKLESDISTAEAQISQLSQEIEAQRADEAATVDSMKRAGVEREKEHTVYVDDVTELKGDIGAIDQAIPALDEATQGAFVQTGHLAGLSKKQVDRLQHVVSKSKSVTESDRQVLTSFLEGKVEAQGIGEVKGMLEVQREEMAKEVVVDDKEEVKDVNIFEELMNAKTNEKETIEETIADKIDRLGILKVSLVELKGELKDAQNALSKDFDVLKKLSETCDAKTHEWDVRKKTRNEELLAIQETVKILNSDENLGLFKKALPSPSLLQLEGSQSRSKALDALKTYAKGMGSEAVPNRTNIDLVMLALSHKGVDFSTVMQMIDNMTALMVQEQSDDDDKKDYCNKQAFENKRKTKALRHKIQTLKQAITTQEEAAKATVEEIKSLQAGVASLDKSVAESTDMRKKEHEEYQKTVQEQAATKDVLLMAKNRLFQFYHPDMTTTLSTTGPYDLGLVQEAPALVQVEAHRTKEEPPEFGSAKTVQGNSVLNMLEGLVTETEKTVAEAKYNEKESQQLYEDMLADAASKREADVKAITSKQKAKATAEGEVVKKSEAKKAEKEELKDVQQYGVELDEECSWLLKNYETRKTAREQEKESLQSAKAALAGAK